MGVNVVESWAHLIPGLFLCTFIAFLVRLKLHIAKVEQKKRIRIPTGCFRVILWIICPHICMSCLVSQVRCVSSGAWGNRHFGYVPQGVWGWQYSPVLIKGGGLLTVLHLSTDNLKITAPPFCSDFGLARMQYSAY